MGFLILYLIIGHRLSMVLSSLQVSARTSAGSGAESLPYTIDSRTMYYLQIMLYAITNYLHAICNVALKIIFKSHFEFCHVSIKQVFQLCFDGILKGNKMRFSSISLVNFVTHTISA